MSFLRLTLLLFPVLLFADSGKYLILLFLIKLSHFPAKTYFISFVSWNQVHVEMEYGLSCRLFIVLYDIITIASNNRRKLFHHLFSKHKCFCSNLIIQLIKVCIVLFRKNQGMSFRCRTCI